SGGTGTGRNFDGFTNLATGAITVEAGSHVNVADFSSDGRLAITGTAVFDNVGTSDLEFGTNSVTTLGIYDPVTGNVTLGGRINLHNTNMRIHGFVRNNGYI